MPLNVPNTDSRLATAANVGTSTPTTFTVGYWSRSPAARSTRICTLGGNRILIGFNSDQTTIRCSRQGTVVYAWEVSAANHGMDLTKWNHIAHVMTAGTSVAVYCNGAPVTLSLDSPGSGYFTAAGLAYIGNSDAASPVNGFGGDIAHLCYHDGTALTAGEIQEMMRRGFTPRGLTAYWPLLEAGGAEYSGAKRTASSVTGSVSYPAYGPPIQPGMLRHPLPEALTAAAAPPAATSAPPPSPMSRFRHLLIR